MKESMESKTLLYTVVTSLLTALITTAALIFFMNFKYKEIESLVVDNNAALLDIKKNIEEIYVLQNAAIKGLKDEILQTLARDVSPINNSVDVTSRHVAAGQRAIELSDKAMENDDTELALLYLINGIHHDPGRLALFEKLSEISILSNNQDNIERAIGLLELATLNVAADDVDALFTQIETLQDKLNEPELVQYISAIDAESEFARIEDSYNLETIWNSQEEVEQLITELGLLYEEVDRAMVLDESPAFDEVLKNIELRYKQAEQVINSLENYNFIRVVTGEVDATFSAEEFDESLANTLLASAQEALAGFWSEIGSLPVAMKEQIKLLPKELAEKELKYNELVATGYLGEIENIKKELSGLRKSSMLLVSKIRLARELIERVFDLTNKISHEPMLKEMAKVNKEIDDFIEDTKTRQRVEYQKWALKSLRDFIGEWNSTMYVTESNATQLFFVKHQVARINLSLITPEVAKIYARAELLYLNKFSESKRLGEEFSIASSSKRELTSF